MIAVGRDLSPRLIKAICIAIVLVGLIYHTLLAHLVALSGLDLWADHGTHTFVPILSGLWWLFLAPKPGFRWADIPLWVAWPVIYCIYILIRASFTGFYPYPFLNVPEIGWDGLAAPVAGLLVGFVLVGLVMTGLGKLSGPRTATGQR
nr:Pr6Pr family membrane protein [Hasllibacter sp. MH4015]